MNQYLNTRERELVKAAIQFKKRAQNLIKAGKLAEEHTVVAETCDRLLEQVYAHAENRTFIIEQHENLKKSVHDNAYCPRCKTNSYLKLRGVDTNEKGWKMNKYICRRCHIEFIWNRPNNPWDMLKFMQDFIGQMDTSLQNSLMDEETRQQTRQVKDQMQQNLEKLIPVIENSDKNLQDIRQKDEQMGQMLHEFKNYLLIEKIKLDTWENQQKQ